MVIPTSVQLLDTKYMEHLTGYFLKEIQCVHLAVIYTYLQL